jgi:hypothetical protein
MYNFFARVSRFFQVSKRQLFGVVVLSIALTIYLFPIWSNIFNYRDLPVQLEIQALNSGHVKIYWEDPSRYPNSYSPLSFSKDPSRNLEVEIKLLPKKNSRALAGQIWLSDMEVDGKKLALSSLSTPDNKWEIVTNKFAPQGIFLVGLSPDLKPLNLNLKGKEIRFYFLQSRWSGIAKFTVNGEERTIDLFSDTPGGDFVQFRPLMIGDLPVITHRTYVVNSPWRRLRVITEGKDKINIQSVKIGNRTVKLVNQNGDFLLPYQLWNRQNRAILATIISFFWMLFLFVSSLKIWTGKPDGRFGNITYIIGLSITIGGFWTLVFYPGLLTSDSVAQWSDALKNHYGTWFPPIMSMVMGLSQFFSNSLSFFCFLQASLLWFAILYLNRQVIVSNKFYIIANFILILLPSLWIYTALIVNNAWTATFAILSSAFLVQSLREKRHDKLWIGVIFISLAACFRREAIFFAIAPILVSGILNGKRLSLFSHLVRSILIFLLVFTPPKIILKLPNVYAGSNPVGAAFINQYIGTIHNSMSTMNTIEIGQERTSIDSRFGTGTFDRLLSTYGCVDSHYILGWPGWNSGTNSVIIPVDTLYNNRGFIFDKVLKAIFQHPFGYLQHRFCNISHLLHIHELSYYGSTATNINLISNINLINARSNSRMPVVKETVERIIHSLLENNILSFLFRHYLFLAICLMVFGVSFLTYRYELWIPSLLAILGFTGFLIPDVAPEWRYLLITYIISWIVLSGAIYHIFSFLVSKIKSKIAI